MSYTLATNSPTTGKPLTLSELLSSAGLEALNARIAANADQWLADNAPIAKTKPTRTQKAASGRKPTMIENPFYGFIGCMTDWGRYPAFAMDIIEGVARLDWHDRPIDAGGKSMPLSVRDLAVIIESLAVVTNVAVEDLLQLKERHARRYVKAIELIIPRMIISRPRSLKNEMEGIEPKPKTCERDDWNDLHAPCAEELAKLHHDLRTLTQFRTAAEYDQDCSDGLTGEPWANVVGFPARKQHPKRHEVIGMLAQGLSQSEIERLTGVQRKTVRRWQAETVTLAA